MELINTTFALLLFFSTVVTTTAVTSAVMAPTIEEKTEAALIIVPGASIPGEAYRPLASKLQEICPLRLWVVLLEGFLLDTPNPLELGGAVTSAIADLKQQGMNSDNIFLAGHSLGGVFVGQYGNSQASELTGILLYASYLTRDVKLSAYPLPVLTISGDLDGQTRITRIVDTFQQLEASLARTPGSKYRTPVITMSGVSHAQFASGRMPPAVVNKDLTPEVTPEVAYSLIANHTSAFLVSTMAHHVEQDLLTKAFNSLDKGYSDTKLIMQPLITAKEMEDNAEGSDRWAIHAQYLEAGVSQRLVNVTDKIQPETDFLSSAPSIRATGSDVRIETFAHLAYSVNPMDISTVASAPWESSVKLKTHEAVRTALPNGTTFPAGSGNLTCNALNQEAFNLALQNSSRAARRRYQDHGRSIFFNDDIIHSSVLAWTASGLDLQEDDQGLHVTSQMLRTSVRDPQSPHSGMLYCKGLSPFRAMEWIYVDSLRDHA